MPAVSLRTDGVVPLRLAELWRLLSLHMDEDTVRAIHPWVLRGHPVRDEGRTTYEDLVLPATHVVEREIRIAGKHISGHVDVRDCPTDRVRV